MSKVQFQRYLKGESFPKPHVLQHICDYFGVDARIYTESLDDRLLADMARRRRYQAPGAWLEKWEHALSFAVPHNRYFETPHLLEDGLYRCWRYSFSRPEVVLFLALQIHEVDGVKLFRGYDPKSMYPPETPARQREYRGIALRLSASGYALLFFDTAPYELAISFAFVSPNNMFNIPGSWTGYSTLCRHEMPNLPRATRLVMEKVPQGSRQVVRLARQLGFLGLDEVPSWVRTILSAPGI